MNDGVTPFEAESGPLPPDSPELQAKAARAQQAIEAALELVEEVRDEATAGSLVHNRAEPAATELQVALDSFTWVPDPE